MFTVAEYPEKPRFIETPKTIVTSEGTPEAKLICKAAGVPHPFITWSKSGVIISPSNHYIIDNDGTLTIRPIQRNDFGTYRCDATNAHGRINATADIIINGKYITIHKI